MYNKYGIFIEKYQHKSAVLYHVIKDI